MKSPLRANCLAAVFCVCSPQTRKIGLGSGTRHAFLRATTEADLGSSVTPWSISEYGHHRPSWANCSTQSKAFENNYTLFAYNPQRLSTLKWCQTAVLRQPPARLGAPPSARGRTPLPRFNPGGAASHGRRRARLLVRSPAAARARPPLSAMPRVRYSTRVGPTSPHVGLPLPR